MDDAVANKIVTSKLCKAIGKSSTAMFAFNDVLCSKGFFTNNSKIWGQLILRFDKREVTVRISAFRQKYTSIFHALYEAANDEGKDEEEDEEEDEEDSDSSSDGEDSQCSPRPPTFLPRSPALPLPDILNCIPS